MAEERIGNGARERERRGMVVVGNKDKPLLYECLVTLGWSSNLNICHVSKKTYLILLI